MAGDKLPRAAEVDALRARMIERAKAMPEDDPNRRQVLREVDMLANLSLRLAAMERMELDDDA